MFGVTCICSVLLILCLCRNTRSQMEGFVVGGEETKIQKYPHSAFLEMFCPSNSIASWICGSSILNQRYLLTAAHCTEECQKGGRIIVVVGNELRTKGSATYVEKFRAHEKYDPYIMTNDICVLKTKHSLPLNSKIKRVVLMKNPTIDSEAYVAGWGMIDENRSVGTTRLKHVKQTVVSRQDCSEALKEELQPGVLCAGTFRGKDYAAAGDSGSALVVKGYIQIGLVSYKIPIVSKSLVVYTDVRHYYNWILQATKKLHCSKKK